MTAPPSLDDRKRALRVETRRRMPLPGSATQRAASTAAQERLAGSALLAPATRVGLYRALPSECATAQLAAALEAAGKVVAYPVVLPAARCLGFRRGTGVFVPGSLGVEEATGEEVALAELDALVVPAVAVDLRGRRLGRGRGYYDATLAGFSRTTIALVFEVQLVPEVPVGEHDHPVAWVCTEARLARAQ